MVGGTVIWVAVVGIAINTAAALLFMSGRKGDLNIDGRFCTWLPTPVYRLVSFWQVLPSS